MISLLIVIALSYIVGSIPNAIIIGRIVKGVDIRNFGSGNAGGTNVSRVLGWKYGILVIFLDAIKGAIAVIFVARLFAGSMPFQNYTPFDDFTLIQVISGLSAVAGHIWTIFAGFKGGKGIATALGILIAIATIDVLLALLIFFIVVIISKYISLGSIAAGIAVPVIIYIRENLFNVDIPGYQILLPFGIALATLVIFTHRKNLVRIIKGTENQVRWFSKKNK